MLFVLAVFVALGACTWDTKFMQSHYDRACTVDERAFSGIRIQYEHGVQLYPVVLQDKQLVITRCDLGSIEYEFELPHNASLFNRDISPPGQVEVLRFVRRSAYQDSQKLSYLPQTLLGAAYSRSEGAKEWVPLSPLVADHWGTTYWTSVTRDGKRQLVLRTSLLRSPDVLEKNYPVTSEWAALIPPYEERLEKDLSLPWPDESPLNVTGQSSEQSLHPVTSGS